LEAELLPNAEKVKKIIQQLLIYWLTLMHVNCFNLTK
jgi:hypothetical protein